MDGIKYLSHCLEKRNSYEGLIKNFSVKLRCFGNRFSIKLERLEDTDPITYTKLVDVELNNVPEERLLAIKLCKEYIQGAKIES